MLKSNFFLKLFITLLVSSIFSLLVLRLYPKTKPDVVSAKYDGGKSGLVSPTPQPEKGSPSNIKISSVSLNLPIAPASIVDNAWVLYDDKVSWLSTSEVPGYGNVILYAHNRPNLFGNLYKTVIGDLIEIDYKGVNFVYQITEKRKVLPSEIESVLSTYDQITLYTCDGTFDQKRLIVVARSVK